MTDDAAGRSAQLAVSRHMAGHAADYGSLDAALGVRGRGTERNRGCASRCQNPSHVRSPIVKDPQANAGSGRTPFRCRAHPPRTRSPLLASRPAQSSRQLLFLFFPTSFLALSPLFDGRTFGLDGRGASATASKSNAAFRAAFLLIFGGVRFVAFGRLFPRPSSTSGHKLHCKFGNLMISADKAIPLGLLTCRSTFRRDQGTRP
jgi:hypothetical protein